MRKTFRCYVNDLQYFDKTETGKRKVWRTDAKPTHCCELSLSYFIWEKSTKFNHYQGYSGYVGCNHVEFIDNPN